MSYKNFANGKIDGKSLKDVAGLGDKDILALLQLGSVYYQEGKLDKAETVLRGIAVTDPDNKYVFSALGALFARKGENEAAVEALNKGLQLNPNDISAYVNRGEVFFKLGRIEDSARDFKKALEMDPHKTDPAANRARLILVGLAALTQKAREKSLVESSRFPLAI